MNYVLATDVTHQLRFHTCNSMIKTMQHIHYRRSVRMFICPVSTLFSVNLRSGTEAILKTMILKNQFNRYEEILAICSSMFIQAYVN